MRPSRIIVKHLFDPISRACRIVNYIGSGVLLFLVLLVSLDAMNRNFFLKPVSGVPEIISLSIIIIVFLQAPQALASKRFTRSDTLMTFLEVKKPRLVRILKSLYDLGGIIVFGAVAYGTCPELADAWRHDEFIGAVGDFTAPVWPVRLAVLTGSTLLVLIFIYRIFLRHSSPVLDPLQPHTNEGDGQ